MTTNTKVCVTGASGYIASWIVKYLLENGCKVHATVRDKENKAKIGQLIKLQDEFGDRLVLFNADLLQEGSFAKAVEGCEIMIHTASPFFVTRIKDPQKQLLDPAVMGTRNALAAASQSGTVKRVVLTSSIAATHGSAADIQSIDGGVFTEKDWNTQSTIKTNPYSLSKTMAEKAAWDVTKSQSQWDLVVINPGFVMGPSLSDRIDGTSNSIMLQFLNGTFRTGVPDIWFGLVDVRDVAKAHIAAAFRQTASGRHLLVEGAYTFLQMGKILKQAFPDLPLPKSKAPKFLLYLVGPFLGYKWSYINSNIGHVTRFDNSYSISDLDISYIPMEQTLIDHANQLIRDGRVKKRKSC
ncbi:MAG: aldehyde reductase [Bacteroidetes bacterium]|nr:aldehyde reductase [Bacteroidota bacterium]MBU1718192.1 aldehyde reductase [Bacteroidota bacterium]